MALILDTMMEILRKPTFRDVVAELTLFAAPLWIAVLVGLFVGWAWRPRWAADLVGGGDANMSASHVLSFLLALALSVSKLVLFLPTHIAAAVARAVPSSRELAEI